VAGAAAEVSFGDQFGNDADGDLGDSLRADVEAQRCVHAGEGLCADSLPPQVVEDQPDLPFAADHADIAGGGFRQVKQCLLVVIVTPSDDDAEGAGIDLKVGEDV